MLPLDLTGIRGENLLFPSWHGYAENNSDTYSSPSLAANCMLSSLLSTNLPLQNSSSSCSHKGGFKAPMRSPNAPIFSHLHKDVLTWCQLMPILHRELWVSFLQKEHRNINRLSARSGFHAFFFLLNGWAVCFPHKSWFVSLYVFQKTDS